MTWQQYTLLVYFVVALIGQFYLLYREPNGQEAFSRVIAMLLSPIGWCAVLYSAGFWQAH